MAGMENVLKGQWKQLRGHAKTWWGKLTDNDLDRINGNRDLLVGALQERYGYTQMQAEQEVDRRITEYDRQYGTGSPAKGNQPPNTRP